MSNSNHSHPPPPAAAPAPWKPYIPGPKMNSSSGITSFIYVSKYILHCLFRMVPYERDWEVLSQDGSRPCLFNYLDYTFRRCLDQGFVLVAGKPPQTYLVFATGLQNHLNQEIYCFCGPNPQYRNAKPTGRMFAIDGFVTEFQLTGEWIQRFNVEPFRDDDQHQQLPLKASFGEGIHGMGSLPQFNPKLPLPDARINFTHLLREGRFESLHPRLPQQLKQACAKAYHGENRSTWSAFLGKLQVMLKRAIAVAIRLARNEPGSIAIHYCRSRQEIQFLLPINFEAPEKCLERADSTVTLRVVRLRSRDGILAEMYEATTLLPVHVARSNARVIMVPPQKWLQ